MTPFHEAVIPPEEKQRHIDGLVKSWRAGDETIRKAFPLATEDNIIATATAYIKEQTDCRVFKNDKYQVMARESAMFGDVGIWLSIKRLDKEPIHDWRDLQEIKNQIAGEENEGIELYPAQSRCVDTANQYHIWVLLGGVRLPVGFTEGIINNKSINDSKQRPFTEGQGQTHRAASASAPPPLSSSPQS